MSREDFNVGLLLDRTLRLVRLGAGRTLLALLSLAALGTAVDTGVLGEGATLSLNFGLSAGTVGVQYVLMRGALADPGGGARRGGGGFGAFFVLGIVSTLAIVIGLALLVVPGIVLIVRWWMAGAFLLDGERGIFQSLEDSWRDTRGRFWPIFLLLLIFWVPVLVVASVAFFAAGDIDNPGPAALFVVNLALYAALIAGWYSTVAAYLLADGRRHTLGDIFS